MTTTDRAAVIRATLKRYGITSRQVSVRADYCSMGSCIRITIKDATVPKSLVNTIADPHEDISRDQWGDILSGGNRFVNVTYSADAAFALAAPYLDAVKLAVAKVTGDDLVPIDGFTHCLIGKRMYGLTLWGAEGLIAEFCSPEGLAQRIGELAINA